MKKRKACLWVLIGFVGALLLAGCSTCTESAKGLAQGFSKGVKKDCEAVPSWDEKIRENYW